jgi:hypothetical protein
MVWVISWRKDKFVQFTLEIGRRSSPGRSGFGGYFSLPD